MNGKFLLDTNIIIALFANDSSVMRHLQSAAELYVPSIALGELYFGAHNSKSVHTNLERLDDFASKSVILFAEAETAKHYGELKAALRAKGKPIPENDIWIAAIARQNDLTLVSRDAHFAEIGDLALQEW